MAKATGFSHFKQVQRAVENRHVFIRRDDIDSARLDFQAVCDLGDRKVCHPLKQLYNDGVMGWVKVLHHHHGHPAWVDDIFQKKLKRLKASGRSSDADDREKRLPAQGAIVPAIALRAAGGERR
jgi:hypothetical protein